VAVLSRKVARVGAGPPQASDLGHGIFGITEIARTVALALLVPFLTLEKTLDAADLSAEATGKDRADAGDGSQLSDDGIVLEFSGDPAVDLIALSFQEADVFKREVEDAADG
jgi:hypothetical protein